MNKLLFTNRLLYKVRFEGDQAKKCFKNDMIFWLINHFGLNVEEWRKQMNL